MTGVILAAVSCAGTAGGGGGGGGTPDAMAWSNPYGYAVASTQSLTVAGVGGGTASISATNSGAASLQSVVNGASKSYSGAFLVSDGDTLGWLLINTGTSKSAGTIVVNSGTFTVGTFTYAVLGGNNF